MKNTREIFVSIMHGLYMRIYNYSIDDSSKAHRNLIITREIRGKPRAPNEIFIPLAPELLMCGFEKRKARSRRYEQFQPEAERYCSLSSRRLSDLFSSNRLSARSLPFSARSRNRNAPACLSRFPARFFISRLCATV